MWRYSIAASLISHAAVHNSLSDKSQFPSFLRTVSNASAETVVFVQIVKHFGWSWIGLLASDCDHCYTVVKKLKEDLERLGVCVSFWEKVSARFTKEKIRSVAERIRRSSARVIIGQCYEMDIKPLLPELNELNVTDIIWIFTTAITVSKDYFPKSSLKILNGSLWLALHAPDMPELKTFLADLHPNRHPEDIFIHPFWEAAFGCKWPNNASSSEATAGDAGSEKLPCTGSEVLYDLDSRFDLKDMSYTYHSYLAVYALATALHDLMSCVPGRGPFQDGNCADMRHLELWQMLHYVKSVHFKTRAGEEIFFNMNGDVPVAFDFINIQVDTEGTARLVKVGAYDASSPAGQEIRMKPGTMEWNTRNSQVPTSVCSESCLPGFRQSLRKDQPHCCFDCVPCPAGEISNETDSASCLRCPEYYWPNKRQTQCAPTTLQFLSNEEPLGVALSCLTCLLFLLTLFILWVFRRYQDTPIVKANNRELSYVLLIALILCFLSAFTFIGHPMRVTCMLRQNSFGISFAISISTVLAKTITVIIAFNARDPTSSSAKWVGTRLPSGVVVACSIVPMLICLVWLLLDPPFPVKIQVADTTIIQCDEGSVLFFYLMLGYLGLLASVSFVIAFHARNLPQSFNEAKFLTFSILVFLAVWVSFIPAYLSTQGKYMVAVEIFAILSSGAGLLGCIFFPKCYIILWRPDMNSRRHVMQRTVST